MKRILFYIILSILLVVCIVPLSSLAVSWAVVSSELWQHLWDYLLGNYFQNTISLAVLVCSATLIVGGLSAFLVEFYEFPLRGFFSYAFYVPLIFPPYVLGFIYLGLSESLSNANHSFSVSGLTGACLSLTVGLFPYVYLFGKLGFEQLGSRALEVGKSMGLGFLASLRKIVIPMTLPWFASGVLLVLLEVLADFGTVSIFSVDTFSVGIFKTWYGFFDIRGASQLSSLLLVFALMVFLLKKKVDAKQNTSSKGKVPVKKVVLTGYRSAGAVGFCLAVVAASVFLPLFQLLFWVGETASFTAFAAILDEAVNTFWLGLWVSIIVVLVAVTAAELNRQLRGPKIAETLIRLPSIGYAVPGAVLAVAVYLPSMAGIEFLESSSSLDLGFLRGGIAIMLFGLFLRFYAVGFSSIKEKYDSLSQSLDEASHSLGVTGGSLFRKVRFPLLYRPILFSALFTFVDTIKEMPLTLMTRPIGMDTLSVKIFEWTSEGEWEKAALPSLAIVLIGVIPIFYMAAREERGGKARG